MRGGESRWLSARVAGGARWGARQGLGCSRGRALCRSPSPHPAPARICSPAHTERRRCKRWRRRCSTCTATTCCTVTSPAATCCSPPPTRTPAASPPRWAGAGWGALVLEGGGRLGGTQRELDTGLTALLPLPQEPAALLLNAAAAAGRRLWAEPGVQRRLPAHAHAGLRRVHVSRGGMRCCGVAERGYTVCSDCSERSAHCLPLLNIAACAALHCTSPHLTAGLLSSSQRAC